MNCFVFRNNTVERFFPKGYSFSGYDDISVIPHDADGYVWFFQLPIRMNESILCEEVHGYSEKMSMVLEQIASSKPVFLLTMEELPSFPMTSGAALKQSISSYNASLFDAQKAYKNVTVIDICEFTRKFPGDELIDWKFWFISQMGLNPRLSKPFMEWFERKLTQILWSRSVSSRREILSLSPLICKGILTSPSASPLIK